MPVVTFVTSHDDPLLATTLMLIFYHKLRFGENNVDILLMMNSQICAHDIPPLPDPYNQNRQLCIMNYDKLDKRKIINML